MSETKFGTINIPPRMLDLTRSKQGYPVPYVVEWSSENELILPPPQSPLFGNTVAVSGIQGVGEPMLGQMHPGRQRECMSKTRCQVCHVELSKSKNRFMAGGPKVTWFREPWVCLECLVFAVQVCPGLVAATRHPTHSLVVHHVHKATLKQLRVGFMPFPLPNGVSYEQHNADGSRAGDAFITPYKFRGSDSACYFITAKIEVSDVYSAAEFIAKFDNKKGVQSHAC